MFRTLLARISLAALLVVACDSKSATNDGAADAPIGGDADALIAGCAGSVQVAGTTPMGALSASVARVQVTVDSVICSAGLQVRVFDDAAGLILDFVVPAEPGDGGKQLSMGPQTRTVGLSRVKDGSLVASATTTALIDVRAVDSGALATCTVHLEDPGAAVLTGGITATIDLTQDGFAVTGTLTVPYCACTRCWDTV